MNVRQTRSILPHLKAVLAAVTLALVLPAVSVAQSYVTEWGTLGSGNGQFNQPTGVAVDAGGNVYVADMINNRIQKFRGDGTYISQWGSAGTGAGQFKSPSGVTIDASGNVYVADTGNTRIQKFTSDGAYLAQWGTAGTGPGEFWTPVSIANDLSGNVYVADRGNWRVEKYTSDGTYVTQWGSRNCTNAACSGQFSQPFGIAVDAANHVYVSDVDRSDIQVFTSDGTYVTKWGSLAWTNSPYGLATDASGYVYVVNMDSQVKKVTGGGTLLAAWGSRGSGPGQMQFPTGVALDAAGNIYVADPLNNKIVKFGFLPTPTKPMTWGHLKQIYH